MLEKIGDSDVVRRSRFLRILWQIGRWQGSSEDLLRLNSSRILRSEEKKVSLKGTRGRRGNATHRPFHPSVPPLMTTVQTTSKCPSVSSERVKGRGRVGSRGRRRGRAPRQWSELTVVVVATPTPEIPPSSSSTPQLVLVVVVESRSWFHLSFLLPLHSTR